MARQTYYEPMIQEEQQASPLRGFQVQIGGVYVLLDDVITALREYSRAYESDEVMLAANWLGSGEQQLPQVQAPGPEFAEPAPFEPNQAEQNGVDRVEVYPDDPTNPRPRWIARSCNSDGKILMVTNGSFDQEYVIRDAEQRWPGKPIHLLTDASIDTVWEERDPGGIRSASSGRRRPSPNRLWV